LAKCIVFLHHHAMPQPHMSRKFRRRLLNLSSVPAASKSYIWPLQDGGSIV
jgi:hypothetical protein